MDPKMLLAFLVQNISNKMTQKAVPLEEIALIQHLAFCSSHSCFIMLLCIPDFICLYEHWDNVVCRSWYNR